MDWPGLVEREYELEAIDAAVAGVDEGAGVFLLFDGEPGIGKGALLHGLTERARARHVRALSPRATPIEQDVALSVRVGAVTHRPEATADRTAPAGPPRESARSGRRRSARSELDRGAIADGARFEAPKPLSG
jgi:predicted ATPase